MVMVLFMLLIGHLLHTYSLPHFQFMFRPGIGDIILYIGILGDLFYILIIGVITIIIIAILPTEERLIFGSRRIIPITYKEGLLHQL
jgi:uncharacterized membrane protein